SKSPPALTTEDVTVFFDALLPLLIRRDEIAGAVVAVVKDGRVLFAKGYGYADVAARRPVSADATLFRVASISKLFTWTAVMQLVEQGKLDLDRDVNLYLDFQIPATYPQAITLRHLMTHTPGFQMASPDHSRWPGTDLLPLKEYLLKYLPPRIFPPGSTPAYSNYGAALAGYIVQRVSGQPFEEYVAEHIFRPLGMAHSTFVQPLPNALKPMMSQGYGLASESAGQFFLVPGSPAGSLYTTATDMARFMLAHLKDGSQLYLVPSLHLGFFISQNSSGRSGRCTM
ncbi:MAG: beta-lactamase family protein, partial [Blastocatellia bacterium]|nr:beta-lactamase family protein [Blastocatellia bacterium]